MLPPNIAAARRFVDFATTGAIPSIASLARCLDELALSFHDTPLGEPSESDYGPSSDIEISSADISARFPDFGHYGRADPNEIPGEAYIGGSIDDILDIANDLKRILWRFERFGVKDAHWHFRFSFLIHWGDHLRGLASYLHARLRLEEEQRFY